MAMTLIPEPISTSLVKANKRLKKLNILATLLLISTCLFCYLAYSALYAVNAAKENRYQSYLLSEQLRLSSDQLTLMARAYTVTGDDKYLDFFNQILAIRDGKQARPEHYQWVYWDLLMPKSGKPPFADGQAESLNSLMKKAGFTELEFEQLAKAKNESDALAKIEQHAFRAIEQAFNSVDNDFHQQHISTISSLYSEDYLIAKAKIMTHINVFYQLQAQRAEQTIALLTWRHHLMTAMTGICAVLVMLCLLGSYRIRSKTYQSLIQHVERAE
ncbi:hypothetical protein HR060_11905 [Catenovulum sp. SM1970]|uniref:hypothetical protein n=1 Tax=Marinifaba aquimaris TaxID=2741323 RepID=UPI001574CF86|nr:hypothetical protein [Marinifaba aquimaris]NTS77568.1 hypothetical protein [Marinifaba aquimaris]